MHATFARSAVVLAAVLLVAGCRSGSGSGWGWGRKSGAATSEPQLPSASAAPSNYGSQPLAGSATQTPSAFADPGAAPAYQAAPYPGQPASYDNANAAPAANYGVPGTPPADYGAAAPQQGPYPEPYGQPPAAATPPGSPGGYPTTATPVGYQPPPQSAQAPAGDPYANSGAVPGAPPSADNCCDNAQPHPAGITQPRTTDIRYGSEPSAGGAAGAESPAPERYGATGPPGEPAPTAANDYRPGSTGYTPGQTGYSPPGVPQYQMPAQPNVVSTARKDPYYRPGGTTDYTPTPGGQTPTAAASADRYTTPAIGHDRADPYAPSGGYQSPATGGASYY